MLSQSGRQAPLCCGKIPQSQAENGWGQGTARREMTLWGLSGEGAEGQQRGWSRRTGGPWGFQARRLRTAAWRKVGAGGAWDLGLPQRGCDPNSGRPARGCPGKGDPSKGSGDGPGLEVMVRKKQADGKQRWEAWMLQARLVEPGWPRAWEGMRTEGAGEAHPGDREGAGGAPSGDLEKPCLILEEPGLPQALPGGQL